MKNNDWKSRLGVMYSTNPDFKYETDEEPEEETLPKVAEILVKEGYHKPIIK